MRRERAVVLLAQMYLPCFDKEEREAIDEAIYALQEPERKHGSWKLNIKESVTSHECSACRIVTDMRYGVYKFCPHCGTIMDGKE